MLGDLGLAGSTFGGGGLDGIALVGIEGILGQLANGMGSGSGSRHPHFTEKGPKSKVVQRPSLKCEQREEPRLQH